MHPIFVLALIATSTPGDGDKSSLSKGIDVQADMLIPVNNGFGAAKNFGYGGAVAAWAQWTYVVAQAELALHYGPGDGGARFIDVPLDLGILILPIEGPVTPIVGGGGSVRYLQVRGLTDERVVGSILKTTVTETQQTSDFGFGAYARAGALFFRGSSVQIAVVFNYEIMFIDKTPQAIVLSIGLAT